MKPTARRIQAGFTLLELLCATLLASMLMVSVLGVVAGFAKNERVLASREPMPAWVLRLEHRLKRDLSAANDISAIEGGVRLEGSLGRDPAYGAATWSEASVEYVVVDSPLGSALVREEIDQSLQRSRRTEVIALNVGQLIVTPLGEPLAAFTPSGPRAVVTLVDHVPPPAVRMVLYTPSGDALFDRCIHRL